MSTPAASASDQTHFSPAHRLRFVLMVVVALVSQLLPAFVAASPAAAAGSPQGDSAASWPSTWTPYHLANGTAIVDAENEAGINPAGVDISSNGGTAPSVYLASDAANVFFRFRLRGDPRDAGKGGFDGAFWLVQIATASDNTVRAVVGLNGKSTSTDYAYVTDSVGGAVSQIYTTPFDNSASQSSMGARGLSDGNGQYFVDFQVPLARITSISANKVGATTPVKLFYGSSAAANLATINKDAMTGSAVDFSGLEVLRLGGTTGTSTSVSCSPAGPIDYGYSATCTVTVTDLAATGATPPTGEVSLAASGGSLSASSCTLSASTSNASTCSVTFNATSAGDWQIGASFAGESLHAASSGSTPMSVAKVWLQVTAQSGNGTYGDEPPAFSGMFSGFANGDEASDLTGTLSCATTATASSLPGVYGVSCSGVSSPNYQITFVDGTYTVLPATPHITTGTPPTLTYGDQLPADPTGGDSADVSGTFTYSPAPGAVLHVGPHTVHVTFTPDVAEAHEVVEYDVTVSVVPAELKVIADDAERSAGEANPSFTASFDAFVNGDDAGDLAGELVCATTATIWSSAAEYPISCSGLSSSDYDIVYVDGTLTVNALGANPPQDDSESPAATQPQVAFITGSTVTGSGLVPVRTVWSATGTDDVAQTKLDRRVEGDAYETLVTHACQGNAPSCEAEFDSDVQARVNYSQRSRATDAADKAGEWSPDSPFAVTDYQIHNSALTYAGKWRATYNASYWHGGIRIGQTRRSSVTLTASGSAFAFITSTGPDMGRFRVFVDGRRMGRFDLYSAERVDRYVAWSTSFDNVGEHRIKIQVLGTKNVLSSDRRVLFDAFAAIGPLTIANAWANNE